MASFDKMSVFPVGYFRAMSSWLLRNRKGLSARIAVIDAELERIGFVHVFYEVTTQPNGEQRMSENRKAISVTPGSTLERLLQAYVAQGGNPYDVSGFMHPDRTRQLDDKDGDPIGVIEAYPHGGVVAPRSVDYDSPSEDPEDSGAGAYRGGWLETDRYYEGRLGGRVARAAGDDASIVRLVHQVRAWANQDIKERLQDLEWRIVKQCDLHEQLEQERDEVLAQAFAGASSALGGFDDDKLVRSYLVQNLVHDMGQVLYPTDEDGVPLTFVAGDKVAYLDFTFPDEVSEARDALGC